jgi:hypothetical protein
MIKQMTTAIVLISATSILTGLGCSSSTTGSTTPGSDSGLPANEDSGATTGPVADGSTPGADSGSETPTDSGTASGEDSAPPAPACYVAPTGYTALTSSPTPSKKLGSCTSTDISAFITACISSTTPTPCNDWQNANLAGAVDGGAGTACGNCIFPADSMGDPTNAGPTYILPSSNTFGVNYAACIQVLDPTNGPACALAIDNWDDCTDYACGSCTSPSTYTTCQSYVDGAGMGCNTPYTSTSVCSTDDADGGPINTCQTGVTTTDFTNIINLFCGSGDAGAP